MNRLFQYFGGITECKYHSGFCSSKILEVGLNECIEEFLKRIWFDPSLRGIPWVVERFHQSWHWKSQNQGAVGEKQDLGLLLSGTFREEWISGHPVLISGPVPFVVVKLHPRPFLDSLSALLSLKLHHLSVSTRKIAYPASTLMNPRLQFPKEAPIH